MAWLSPIIVSWRSTRARSARFSNSSRRCRRALRTTSTVFSSDSGFSTKSKAPSLMARTADSMLPCPEISTTCASTCRSRRRASVARPSMPGSHTSRMIRSTGPRVSRSRQASPVGTASTVYSSSRSTPVRAVRTPGSSSTIRIVGFIDYQPRSHEGHEESSVQKPFVFFVSSRFTAFVFSTEVQL